MQTFINTSNSGNTFLMRDRKNLIDKSKLIVYQVQNTTSFFNRLKFTYGFDALWTRPITENTINGVNEDDDDINEYDLSTAWDVSTASFVSLPFDISGLGTQPKGLFFKPDGTKMYVIVDIGNDINEYDLGLVILVKVGIGKISQQTKYDLNGPGSGNFFGVVYV